MKILSAEQIRAADAYTIKNEPVSSLDLMERAAMQCTQWLLQHFNNNQAFTILCGMGNNGGDGLAIARQLADQGRKVFVYILKITEKASEDFTENLVRLQKVDVKIDRIESSPHIENIKLGSVIIDALFGTGLSRIITGLSASLIHYINATKAIKVAIDIPSGLYANEPIAKDQVILRVNHTLSFELPKLAFMLPESAKYVGDWQILPIGLNAAFIQKQKTNFEFLKIEDIRSYLKKRTKFSHKGTFGHVLLASGSFGKMGAAILSTRACLRTGVGLVTSLIPLCGYEIMQQSVPEAMVKCQGETDLSGNFESSDHTIAIGPGIGSAKNTSLFLFEMLKNTSKPMVLDADALNILAKNKDWLAYIPDNSILTPHVKEFKRLVGTWSNDYEKLNKLTSLAHSLNSIVILKGALTAIAMQDGKVYFNSTGNVGMATAGSGDVLTGIICSLLAQGYSSIKSAQIGVFIHGLAGDLAANKMGEEALIASDIIDHIGFAFQKIRA
ncbi:MAG: hypothetical protein RLZZ337_1130 [Bacteroidota bacterium]